MPTHHGQRKSFRDYSRRRYGNPLFNAGGRGARHGRRLENARRYIWLGATALFIALGGWYALWSPFFAIASFDIRGADTATEEAVRGILKERMNGHRLLLLPERNLLLFDANAARDDIKNAFFLEELRIAKKLPRAIVVELKEKPVAGALADGNRFLALDGRGFIIRDLTEQEIVALHDLPPGTSSVPSSALGAESMEVSAPSGSSPSSPASDAPANPNPYPLIVDAEAGDRPPKPGDQALPEGTMELILQANSRLPDICGSPVRWFTVERSVDAVDATIAGDWHVFLGASVPFDTQGERLSLVLKEKVGSRKNELEYVDLRYNERVFFRYRQDAP